MPRKDPPVVWVDPHEGSKHLVGLFTKLGVSACLKPLRAGDVSFIGNGPDGSIRIGIELKGGVGGSDFLQSMQSGRLVGHQLPKLVREYDRAYLFVEGIRATRGGLVWRPKYLAGKVRPFYVKGVERYIAGLEEWHVRIRWTKTPRSTVREIVDVLMPFWGKPYHEHSSTSIGYDAPVTAVVSEPEAKTRLRLAASKLPGIGWGRSKAVAEYFGSIANMVEARVGEWEQIDGIGKGIAEQAVLAIGEDYRAATRP